MKFPILCSLLPAALCMLLASCNKDQDERFIPTPFTPDDYSRIVVMYDFTGQNCVNCPTGHEMMGQITELCGDKFIPVSIHCGGDAWSMDESEDWTDVVPGYRGLRNATGEAIAKKFGQTETSPFPSAVVDAHAPLMPQVSQWLTAVVNDFVADPHPAVSLNLDCEISGEEISTEVNVTSTAAFQGDVHVWVLESGIVAYQKTPSGELYDYTHNHVFRAAAKGVDGEAISIAANQDAMYQDKIKVKPFSGSMDNMTVVAFVADATGIIQATEWQPKK